MTPWNPHPATHPSIHHLHESYINTRTQHLFTRMWPTFVTAIAATLIHTAIAATYRYIHPLSLFLSVCVKWGLLCVYPGDWMGGFERYHACYFWGVISPDPTHPSTVLGPVISLGLYCISVKELLRPNKSEKPNNNYVQKVDIFNKSTHFWVNPNFSRIVHTSGQKSRVSKWQI